MQYEIISMDSIEADKESKLLYLLLRKYQTEKT